MLRKRNVLEDAWSHVGSRLDVATFLARLRASGCTLLRDACCASNKLADVLAEGWSLKRREGRREFIMRGLSRRARGKRSRTQQAESAVGRAVLSGAHNCGETWHFDGPSERLNHSRLEP